MAGISKDARKLNLAQSIYDEGVDKWLAIMLKLSPDVEEMDDILHGYAMGKKDPKYKISMAQHSALKDRFNFWASFMKSPDKAVAHINDGLKKAHTKSPNTKTKIEKTQLAVFSTIAKK